MLIMRYGDQSRFTRVCDKRVEIICGGAVYLQFVNDQSLMVASASGGGTASSGPGQLLAALGCTFFETLGENRMCM